MSSPKTLNFEVGEYTYYPPPSGGAYRGDVPYLPYPLGNPPAGGEAADIASISSQRGRDPGLDIGNRRRNDDYYYQLPKKDPLGWNSLIDEGCKAWQAVLAEFLGVLVLVFVGCGSCINWKNHGGAEPNVILIAFAFGTARATIATVIGHISGTHVNPAVTIGLCIGKKIKPAKALFYIVFQVLGGICGAALLNYAIPESMHDGLGQTHPNPHITQLQAIIVEAVITFMLTLTVFAVCDELRNDIKGSAPLMIGFVIMACHLMAIQFTGSSMNPARSTGPAIIKNNFQDLWIYWVGPIFGGIIAGTFYIFLLHKEEENALKDQQTANARATGPQPDTFYQLNDPVTPNGTGNSASNLASNQSLPP